MFEAVVTYCHHQMSSIPLTFVLGFYVSLIVGRWWSQYTLLPWPDTMAILVIRTVHYSSRYISSAFIRWTSILNRFQPVNVCLSPSLSPLYGPSLSFLTGKDERQRLMRRNIIRYVLLSYCMATRWGRGKNSQSRRKPLDSMYVPNLVSHML